MRERVLERLCGSDNILKKKPRLRILILGPYRPESAIRQLISVRDHLISKGYKSTRLVMDFNEGDETDEEIFKKSKRIMEEWADVMFFFFFQEAVKESKIIGVYDEFVTLCESLPEKIEYSVIFIDENVYSNISSMFKGRIKCFEKEYSLKVAFLESPDDAMVLAEKHALNFLARLGKFL